MAKTSTLKKIAIGTAIAGAAGYVAGVLSAPNEGRKTRNQLRKNADKSIVEVEKQLKELHTELADLMNDARKQKDDLTKTGGKRFSKAVDNAKSAKDKLREVLSAVHEGEASDKDLKNAFEDAARTLQHLKQFIKK